jgi:Tfp pilus assembly protein PilF
VLSFDNLCLKNQYDAAHEVADELVKIAPLAEESFSCRGYTNGQMNRIREAERDYATAVRLGYAPGLVCYNLGIYVANRGKYAESLGPFEQAVVLDPALEELSRQRIVDVSVALKRYAAALAQAEALWRMSPADPKRAEQVGKIKALMAAARAGGKRAARP